MRLASREAFPFVAPASCRSSFPLVAQASACALLWQQSQKLNSKETVMSSLRPQDRKSLCRFTFSDGRRSAAPSPISPKPSSKPSILLRTSTSRLSARTPGAGTSAIPSARLRLAQRLLLHPNRHRIRPPCSGRSSDRAALSSSLRFLSGQRRSEEALSLLSNKTQTRRRRPHRPANSMRSRRDDADRKSRPLRTKE
jgi:hypothetical protein